MVVFNFFAILQAIIVVAIVALLHWVLNLIGFSLYLLDGTYEMPFSFMLAGYICAHTELRGMKGRLFWIPMWILFIVASIVVAEINNYDHKYYSFTSSDYPNIVFMDYYFFLYIFAILIIYYFYKNLNKFMMKRWEVSKAALVELTSLDYKELDKKEFWEFISLAYFKPSHIYYNTNEIWSKIYKNSIPQKEYITHTANLLGVLNEFGVEQKKHKKWIGNFYNAIIGKEKLNELILPFLAFKRLEECIRQNA